MIGVRQKRGLKIDGAATGANCGRESESEPYDITSGLPVRSA